MWPFESTMISPYLLVFDDAFNKLRIRQEPNLYEDSVQVDFLVFAGFLIRYK